MQPHRLAVPVLASLLSTFAGCAGPGATPAPTPHARAVEPACPADAPEADDPLQALVRGNERYVSGHSVHPHLDAARRAETVDHGQHPFATIVTCSDSRIPVEDVFDEGVGDLFVIRVAGNVIQPMGAGSVEYAVAHCHCPLVVVMGHTGCGAVTAAVQHPEEHGSIPALLEVIEPAVQQAARERPDLHGTDLVPTAVRANVWQSVGALLSRSATIRAHLATGKLQVVGAIYDLRTGRIEWLGEHPDQERLLGESSQDGFAQAH